jgi:hypothetical protein
VVAQALNSPRNKRRKEMERYGKAWQSKDPGSQDQPGPCSVTTCKGVAEGVGFASSLMTPKQSWGAEAASMASDWLQKVKIAWLESSCGAL